MLYASWIRSGEENRMRKCNPIVVGGKKKFSDYAIVGGAYTRLMYNDFVSITRNVLPLQIWYVDPLPPPPLTLRNARHPRISEFVIRFRIYQINIGSDHALTRNAERSDHVNLLGCCVSYLFTMDGRGLDYDILIFLRTVNA